MNTTQDVSNSSVREPLWRNGLVYKRLAQRLLYEYMYKAHAKPDLAPDTCRNAAN